MAKSIKVDVDTDDNDIIDLHNRATHIPSDRVKRHRDVQLGNQLLQLVLPAFPAERHAMMEIQKSKCFGKTLPGCDDHVLGPKTAQQLCTFLLPHLGIDTDVAGSTYITIMLLAMSLTIITIMLLTMLTMVQPCSAASFTIIWPSWLLPT